MSNYGHSATAELEPNRVPAEKETREVKLEEVPRSAYTHIRWTVKPSDIDFVKRIWDIKQVRLPVIFKQ